MTHNIKLWQKEERPREKMIAHGCESLTSAELVAILFRSGSSSEDAVNLARQALALADNNLSKFCRLSIDKLCSIPGIGRVKALSIIAAAELGRRTFAEGGNENKREALPPQISNSEQVAAMMRPLLYGLDHEECWVLFINRAGRLIGKERVSYGGGDATVIDNKIVVKKALEKMASSIILVHNHPSGNPRPGRSDVEQTNALQKAAQSLDITLMDHIIMSDNKYFSFSDEKVNFAKS